MVEKIVEMGSYGEADFSVYDSITTRFLCSCVAVIVFSRADMKGKIAHITVFDDVRRLTNPLLNGFKPESSLVYLVGGDNQSFPTPNRTSRDIVNDVSSILLERSFRVSGRDLYGRACRNVTLSKEGVVSVSAIPYEGLGKKPELSLQYTISE